MLFMPMIAAAERAACRCAASRWGSAQVSIARTETTAVTLTVIEALGRAEHNEFRWVDYEGAGRLVSPRVQPIVDWAWQQIEE
jgi:hypothetical protein